MTRRIVHHVTGYDRSTDELAVEYPIPSADLPSVKKIAKISKADRRPWRPTRSAKLN